MSSISVRFYSFSSLYSIFNERKLIPYSRKLGILLFSPSGFEVQFIAVLPRSAGVGTADWSVWMDSNHRPHAYQACALTTWATNRFLCSLGIRLNHQSFPAGFEATTHRCTSPFLGPGTAGWWRWWGSNPWPPACRAGALPAELHPHVSLRVFSFLKDHFWSPKIEQQKFHTSSLKLHSSFRLRQIRENLSRSP